MPSTKPRPRNSEQIKAFLDFVSGCQSAYALAVEDLQREDDRLQDLLHAIEFESNSKQRSKICTKLHQSRKERREYKDLVEETQDIVIFFQDPSHKKTLDHLVQLLGKVRKVEQHHTNRSYFNRVEKNN